MAELFMGISTILSYLTTLFFWSALVIIIAMLRRLTKDIADVKRTVAALEETMVLVPRPDLQNRPDHG